MTIQDAKNFLKQFPKKKRFRILEYLYDKGIIEQREYTIAELAEMTGYSVMHTNEIFNKSLEKCKTLINKEHYYE